MFSCCPIITNCFQIKQSSRNLLRFTNYAFGVHQQISKSNCKQCQDERETRHVHATRGSINKMTVVTYDDSIGADKQVVNNSARCDCPVR